MKKTNRKIALHKTILDKRHELESRIKEMRRQLDEEEWERIDEVRTELERPIIAEMDAIFEEQRQEAISALDDVGDRSYEQRVNLRLSLERLFNIPKWLNDTWSRLARFFQDAIFAGYQVGENQIDIDLPDLTSFDPVVRDHMEVMLEKTRGITNTTARDLQRLIDDALRDGWPVQRLADEISIQFEQYKGHRSKLIAQTNVTGAFGRGQLQAFERAGLKKRWLTQRDGRVRDTHRRADGQEQQSSDPFQVGQALLMYPGDPETDVPKEIFNCFVGETDVYSANIRGAFRSWYKGSLITIETASGNKVTCTPNHPILTERGWTKAERLLKGDRVLSCINSEWISRSDMDIENRPSKIKQVFDSLAVFGTVMRESSSVVNFHGDRPHSDVDIVRANGELHMGDIARKLKNPVRKLLLSFANFAPCDVFSLRLFYREPMEKLWRFVSNCLMRLRYKSHSFLTWGIRHAGVHRLASSPYWNFFFDKPTPDNASAHTEFLSELLFTDAGSVEDGYLVGIDDTPFPARLDTKLTEPAQDRLDITSISSSDTLSRFTGKISFDNVVDVSIRNNFSGHVYTLETKEGIYLSNGIVSKNCRCSMLPIPQ